jgi:hypothetical protein
MNYFNNLPDELVEYIFNFLDINSQTEFLLTETRHTKIQSHIYTHNFTINYINGQKFNKDYLDNFSKERFRKINKLIIHNCVLNYF